MVSSHWHCDQGRHLQECSAARAGKCPPGVLLQCFWAPGSECPKECFLECFLASLGLKNAKKHSKSALWGTRSQVPKNTEKALRSGTFRPGPLSRAVPEYCWLCRLVSGMAPKRGPSVFPIDLQTALGDALRLSPSTVGSPDWF